MVSKEFVQPNMSLFNRKHVPVLHLPFFVHRCIHWTVICSFNATPGGLSRNVSPKHVGPLCILNAIYAGARGLAGACALKSQNDWTLKHVLHAESYRIGVVAAIWWLWFVAAFRPDLCQALSHLGVTGAGMLRAYAVVTYPCPSVITASSGSASSN